MTTMTTTSSSSTITVTTKDNQLDEIEDSKSGKSFTELYELDKELGVGAFSVVKVGHHRQSQKGFAIKTITKSDMQEFDKQCLQEEISILTDLRHEHIIRLWDVFDEPEYIHLVLEKVDGGQLLERIIEKENYTECEARDLCLIIFEAIRHCHEHKVAHRDLKPDNLLMTSCQDDSSIKIADFGFAKLCPHDAALKTQLGSARHVAPEIIKKISYGTKVDMWALGVIAYTLIGGYPPFFANCNRELFPLILNADYDFDDESWEDVHQDCKDMINGLLTIDPKKRWSAQQVLDCQWMKDDPTELRRTSLMPNQTKLMQFNASMNELHASVSEIGSATADHDSVDHTCSRASLDVSHQELLEFHAIVGGNRKASLVGLETFEGDVDQDEEEEKEN